MPRSMADPDFEYRPWSPERRERASKAAIKRAASDARVWNRALDAAEIAVRDTFLTGAQLGYIVRCIRKLRKSTSDDPRKNNHPDQS